MTSTCQRLGKIIKKCDHFLTLITFRMDDELEYKSVLGGITTIIFYFLAFLYFCYCATSYILKQNVELIYMDKILEGVPITDFRKSEFMVSLCLEFNDAKLEEEISALNYTKKYFNYTFNLRTWIGGDNITMILNFFFRLN